MISILQGDWIDRLQELPDNHVQCCVTSPPYWGLRNYGIEGQLGLEKTPEEFVSRLVQGFREVRRVLRDDGTLWLNLGDSYARQAGDDSSKVTDGGMKTGRTGKSTLLFKTGCNKPPPGFKEKDLIGIPWMTAFALRADGWYLRSDIIWNKPNPMPEGVTDRPTKAHEYIFLLTKNARYFYDAEAIKDPPSPALIKQIEEGYNGKAIKDYNGTGAQDPSATKAKIINSYRKRIEKIRVAEGRQLPAGEEWNSLTPAEQAACGRNKRSVWTVPPASYAGDHYATFPPDLIKPCVLAGTKSGDIVLDPFGGSGTTGEVALELGRKAILIELNPESCSQIHERTNITSGLAL